VRRRTLIASGVAATATSVLSAGCVAKAEDGLELLTQEVVVIARWSDPNGHTIELQNFVSAGENFIPIFSDDAHFRTEAAGSGFEHEGVAINLRFLVSILRGDELLILNPVTTKLRLRKSDLENVLRREGT
jgi:hypothetical protein